MEIKIRNAQNSDIDSIMELTKKIVETMMEKHKINQWDENYPNREVFYDDIKLQNLYVATLKNKIVGYICVNNEETKEYKNANWRVEDKYLLIHRVGVNPQLTKKSIATKMIVHAEKIAKQRGAIWMKIDTNSSNELMKGLIRKCGYEFIGELCLNPEKPIWYAYDKKL
ncbi:MAG: GNAT family N-acetyltransferase [Mycoplasmatales bacterium]